MLLVTCAWSHRFQVTRTSNLSRNYWSRKCFAECFKEKKKRVSNITDRKNFNRRQIIRSLFHRDFIRKVGNLDILTKEPNFNINWFCKNHWIFHKTQFSTIFPSIPSSNNTKGIKVVFCFVLKQKQLSFSKSQTCSCFIFVVCVILALLKMR